ncbi:hypothetical protein [Wolbachia endosymbiont (group A) of Bibio marci]|nr:hypothetical protein [Wolbachia endosymbiont (group A) of Bibio marci]
MQQSHPSVSYFHDTILSSGFQTGMTPSWMERLDPSSQLLG